MATKLTARERKLARERRRRWLSDPENREKDRIASRERGRKARLLKEASETLGIPL